MQRRAAYSRQYYDSLRAGSRNSARAVVPFLMQWVSPRSVIDLGCGTGDWLSIFKEAEVQHVVGVDGDYVDRTQLAVKQSEFIAHDLRMPYVSNRRFDLAVSLEVAEHLPVELSGQFIQSLAGLAPIVLFSAAIPDQPGEQHINCQWPAYWSHIFKDHGFSPLDVLRLKLWDDNRIEWWYRQNIIIYASDSELYRWPALESMRNPDANTPLPLVHPEMFQQTYHDLLDWNAEWERKYWELWEQTKRPDYL